MSNETIGGEVGGSELIPNTSKKQETAKAVAEFLESLLNYSAESSRRVSIGVDYFADEDALQGAGVVVKSPQAAAEASKSLAGKIHGTDAEACDVTELSGGAIAALGDIVDFAISHLQVPESVQTAAKGAVASWAVSLEANADSQAAYAIEIEFRIDPTTQVAQDVQCCDRVIAGSAGVLAVHASLN